MPALFSRAVGSPIYRTSMAVGCAGGPGRAGRARLRHRDQLGELPEFLGRRGEVELIPGPVRPP